MCKFYLMFLLLVKLFQNSYSDKYDDLLQMLTNFVVQRNVQTVSAHYMCWPSGKFNFSIVFNEYILKLTIPTIQNLSIKLLIN